jgi:hypothetical protein
MRRIQKYEAKDELKRVNGGKAMGPNGIPIDVWRSLRDIAIVGSLNWSTLSFD